jgi:hypothetical protein
VSTRRCWRCLLDSVNLWLWLQGGLVGGSIHSALWSTYFHTYPALIRPSARLPRSVAKNTGIKKLTRIDRRDHAEVKSGRARARKGGGFLLFDGRLKTLFSGTTPMCDGLILVNRLPPADTSSALARCTRMQEQF